VSDALAALAEADGARPAAGLRVALQQQCRAWLDALHARTMARLNGAGWLTAGLPVCVAGLMPDAVPMLHDPAGYLNACAIPFTVLHCEAV